VQGRRRLPTFPTDIPNSVNVRNSFRITADTVGRLVIGQLTRMPRHTRNVVGVIIFFQEWEPIELNHFFGNASST
jgi:hypothetical protein